MPFRICLLFVALALAAAVAFAQEEDAEGCSDLSLLQRMPGCVINSCDEKEFDGVEMQVGPQDPETGEIPTRSLEGRKQVVDYYCPSKYSMLQLARNAENAFKKAGYTVVFSGKTVNANPGVTVRKGAQWVHVETHDTTSGPEYIVTALKTEEMEQAMEASAAAWADAIRASGRVAIHDITFDTAKATLRPECDPVLNEVMVLMRENADWKLRVEGHTDDTGDASANQKLSEQRAAAVVTWLTLHGIDASRLSSAGFGESKPVADNGTEEGRAKNRRVELVKM